MWTDFRKVPQHSETKLWSKRLAFVIVFFIQDLMHNELWGRAEILANFFVIIVFVNALHPLNEVFYLLLLRVSKPQGFIALPFALDSLCNIILSFNAKSIVIFIVKVKNRTAGKKKNEYEMILFLLNVLLPNTII